MSRNSRRSREARLRMELYSDQSREPALKADGPLRRGVFLLPATITSIGLLSGLLLDGLRGERTFRGRPP